MKNLVEIRAIVHDYINSTTPDVDQHIFDAINFLSNFFHIKKIDTSETTVADQSWIDYATDFLRLKILVIDGVYIKDLLSFDNLEDVADLETQLWHIADGKVQLTSPMSTTGEAITMIYEAEFKQPEAAVATDVPNKLLELVYVGATYRYFDKLAAIVATAREDQADITPKEVEAIRKQWKDRFDSLLKDLT